MSRAEELRKALGETHALANFHLASNDGAAFAIANKVCDTLGITREMVDRLNNGYVDAVAKSAHALTTLLEVAGR